MKTKTWFSKIFKLQKRVWEKINNLKYFLSDENHPLIYKKLIVRLDESDAIFKKAFSWNIFFIFATYISYLCCRFLCLGVLFTLLSSFSNFPVAISSVVDWLKNCMTIKDVPKVTCYDESMLFFEKDIDIAS